MPFYVDRLQSHHLSKRASHVKEWCHLATDEGLEALHAFARAIGLPDAAFHQGAKHPHYDCGPVTRARAVAMGAIEVESKELFRRCFARRKDEPASSGED